MSEMEIGPASMLDLVNAAISQGAAAGDVLAFTDGDGNAQEWTLGQALPKPDCGPLVKVSRGES